MWTHVYTRPVYTCTLPSSALTGSGSQLSSVVMSRPLQFVLRVPCSKMSCIARSHFTADVSHYNTESPAAAVRSYQVNIEWEIISDIYSVLLCSRCSQLNVGACGAMGLVRDFCGLLQLKECSLWSKCYWKWISHTLVSSNIPRWTGGNKTGEWWSRQYLVNLLRSETWEWFETEITKTAQTEIIQSVSRDQGCRAEHCVSARSAVSANLLLSLLNLWLETSQRHPEKERIPVLWRNAHREK